PVRTLRLVVAQDVRAQAPLLGVGAGGLVVCNALRRDEQGGDGVDERGLARADVTREQRIFAVRPHGPDAAMKGAPVVHLEAVESKAGKFIGFGKLEEQVLQARSPLYSSSRSRSCRSSSWLMCPRYS